MDSCLNPFNGRPAALSYLEDIGVDPAAAISFVLVTHWDDDHIRGVAEIIDTAVGCTVACTAAFNKMEAMSFVFRQADRGGHGSGVTEFSDVLRIMGERGRSPIWAMANTDLHPLPPGDSPAVKALSPSHDTLSRSLEALIEGATEPESAVPRRYRAPEGPNGASVAAVVRKNGITILLGADLEKSDNPEAGWDAVLTYAAPAAAASLVKVPHHASPGAHHDDMWKKLAEPDSVAIVTPWSLGAGFLPAESDLIRLRGVTDKLYLAAVPTLARVKKDPAVNRLVNRLHGDKIEELRGWGQVRARRRPDEPEWRVELEGDAIRVVL